MKVLIALMMSFVMGGQLHTGHDFGDLDRLIDWAFSPGNEVRMLAFGDLMLGRDVAAHMERHGADYPFEKIFASGALDPGEFDLVTANLEGPIVEAPKRADLKPFFAFDPVVVPPLLKKWGFNLLNLANNHTWDHSARGWESTLGSLHEQGIFTVGHPKNLFDDDTLELTIKGLRLGFIGISDMVFEVDWEAAKSTIKELKERNDFVVVMIHWGKEYQATENLRQRDKGHGLVEAGADLIIGHHPHVVQGSEFFEGKWIYYSLGNFVFDQYFSEAVQKGLALDIRFQEDGDLVIKEIPFRIQKGQPTLDL